MTPGAPDQWPVPLDMAEARLRYWHAGSRLINLPELHVHVIDEGHATDQPAIVILSGQWLCAHSFEEFAGHLRDKARVIRVDLPGHGLTDRFPDDDYSAPAYACLIHAVVKALDLPRYILVGTSFSGIAAALHAAGQPTGLVGLALATSSGLRRDPSAGAPNLPPSDPILAETREGRHSRDFYAWKLASLLHRTWDSTRFAAMVTEVQCMDGLAGRDEEASLRAAQHDPDCMAKTLPQIRIPTLVQWSSASTYLPPQMAHRMAGLLPDCRGEAIYPATGHLLLIDAPEETACDVLAFTESLQ